MNFKVKVELVLVQFVHEIFIARVRKSGFQEEGKLFSSTQFYGVHLSVQKQNTGNVLFA